MNNSDCLCCDVCLDILLFVQYPIQIWGFPAVVLLIILVQFLRRGRIKADTDEDQKEAARDLVILNVILFTPLIVIFLILLITGGNIGIGGLGLQRSTISNPNYG